MIWPFHRHKWLIIWASVTPPRSSYMLSSDEIANGVTCISQRCSTCGAARSQRLIGCFPDIVKQTMQSEGREALRSS